MKEAFRKQVLLLLDILPEVAKGDVFALHGGTAINLFYFNMPRLSIDLDLTYVPVTENRDVDLQNIRFALERIKERIRKHFPTIRFSDPARAEEELKIICSTSDAMVKIEVNQINRGIIAGTELVVLCDKAQVSFNKFCEVTTVSQKQLWGGKVIAALDRQHPRDLFDIRNLFNEKGYSSEIKDGFLFFLLCSKRPIHELLNPRRVDQTRIFESQFMGMSDDSFSYDEFERTRDQLINTINESLTFDDKEFLMAFSKGEPNWAKVDYGKYPAIKWKLLNINKLKESNPQKFLEQINFLNQTLFNT